MHRAGAALVAQGVAMKALVSEIRDGRLEAGIVARFVALLVLALLLPRARRSRRPAAAPLRLTLQQAVTLGLKQAPEIAIANLTLAESQQARTAARGALLPQVSFGVSEKVTRASLESVFGKKVPAFRITRGRSGRSRRAHGVDAGVRSHALEPVARGARGGQRRRRAPDHRARAERAAGGLAVPRHAAGVGRGRGRGVATRAGRRRSSISRATCSATASAPASTRCAPTSSTRTSGSGTPRRRRSWPSRSKGCGGCSASTLTSRSSWPIARASSRRRC
jgi:hypothetical protein